MAASQVLRDLELRILLDTTCRFPQEFSFDSFDDPARQPRGCDADMADDNSVDEKPDTVDNMASARVLGAHVVDMHRYIARAESSDGVHHGDDGGRRSRPRLSTAGGVASGSRHEMGGRIRLPRALCFGAGQQDQQGLGYW